MALFERVRNSIDRRTILRRVAALLTVLTLGLQAITPAASAANDSEISGCNYETSRVLGYLWADGKYVTPANGSDSYFFFRTRSQSISDHMARNLDELGLTYTLNHPNNHDNFKVFIDNLDADLLQIRPAWYTHTKCDRPAFLASIIESEGSAAGKVMDDPVAARRFRTRGLLRHADIGIGATLSGQGVFADQVDWPKFGTVPFVACGRVPGGSANCDRSLAPTD